MEILTRMTVVSPSSQTKGRDTKPPKKHTWTYATDSPLSVCVCVCVSWLETPLSSQGGHGGLWWHISRDCSWGISRWACESVLTFCHLPPCSPLITKIELKLHLLGAPCLECLVCRACSNVDCLSASPFQTEIFQQMFYHDSLHRHEFSSEYQSCDSEDALPFSPTPPQGQSFTFPALTEWIITLFLYRRPFSPKCNF